MTHPFVSIILPAYNASMYLQRSIDSLLNQTYQNFELIIIDDGSSDSTWDIISNNSDIRIRPHRFTENRGLIAALNYGLENMAGDYIARMDADDMALPNRLEKQVAFLESNPDHCACGTAIINTDGIHSSYMRYPRCHDEILVSMALFERNICHPTVMIRSNVLLENNIRYRPEYIHAEDYALWVDLAKFGKLHNLEEGLLKYFRHNDQVSLKHYDDQMATSRRVVLEQLKQFYRPPLSEPEMEAHLDLLVHPINKVGSKANNQSIEEWKNKLLAYNRKYHHFYASYYDRLIVYKYFRSALYYNFPLRDKLNATVDLIKIAPVFGVLTLITQCQRFVYYKLIKPRLA
jgi:glycosyltransferase involved in cell wall biosynthesis